MARKRRNNDDVQIRIDLTDDKPKQRKDIFERIDLDDELSEEPDFFEQPIHEPAQDVPMDNEGFEPAAFHHNFIEEEINDLDREIRRLDRRNHGRIAAIVIVGILGMILGGWYGSTQFQPVYPDYRPNESLHNAGEWVMAGGWNTFGYAGTVVGWALFVAGIFSGITAAVSFTRKKQVL